MRKPAVAKRAKALALVVLDEQAVDALFVFCAEGADITVNLENCTVVAGEQRFAFTIDESRRSRLLAGIDDIGATLQYRDDIFGYEQLRRAQRPWVFGLEAG